MTDPIGPRITGMEHRVEDLKKAVEGIANHRNGGQAVIQFSLNAGGMGIWVATTACLVMLAVSAGLGIMVIDQGRKIDRLQDHLSAIYMMAPQLKEKRQDLKNSP